MIYIHIPFCKQACHYCDFHFSTSLKNKEAFLWALKKEISLRKDYLKFHQTYKATPIHSVYFGGGTPSILTQKDINEIFDHLNQYFVIDNNAEITLEANPDDLSNEKLTSLKSTPVNRLSIGIQSFSDADLELLNRAHRSPQAIETVKCAQDKGFENITIDLIYGIPTLSNEQWKKNLDLVFGLGVPHVSAYCLTVEPKTALAHLIKKGTIKPVDEIKAVGQFDLLMGLMKKNNFIHYEISNFSKKGFISRHNSNYWKGEVYLGLGPSAHSYDGNSRQWNISNNTIYIKVIEKNETFFEKEILSMNDKYNEYVMTSLRTMWGCDLNFVRENFGEEKENYLVKNSEKFMLGNQVLKAEDRLLLTSKGKFIADHIISELFV